MFWLTYFGRIVRPCEAVPYTTKTSTCKVHCVDHFCLTPFTGRSSIYSEITTMSITEIVSLACLFILFLIMFFVIKNHLVLMQLRRQRAERHDAMMDVQDRENPTLDTPLQPRVGEMAPIGMHVIPHQRGVLESGRNNYIGTAIGIQRMAMEPNTFSHQRIANRPLPRENEE